MKKVKRLLPVALTTILLLAVIFVSVMKVDASTDISGAKSIAVNTTYGGTIESGYNYEKDYYKFTLSQSGYVTVSFTNSSPSASTSDAWTIKLLTNYAAQTITSNTARLNNSAVSLTTIGLPAGTYYICVESTGYSSAVSANSYTIKASFTAATNWEKEFNESTETANSISTNKTYYGTVHTGYDYDKDFYKFTLSKDGYITVDFTNSSPVQSASGAWEVILYGFHNDAITSISTKTIYTNNSKVSLTTQGLPAGTYYICVQSTNWSKAVSNAKYALCVNYTVSNNWEKELNEDVASATSMEVNEEYYGTTKNGYDYEKDYYKFEINKDGYVDVEFVNSAPSLSTDGAWTVTLYGFQKNALVAIVSRTVYANNNGICLPTTGLSKGTYYICVQSTNWSKAVSNAKYALCVNYTVSNNWEKELNENSTDSNSIQLDNTYYGTIKNGYDYEKDYYNFTITKEGLLKVYFYNEIGSISASASEAWTMKIYNSSFSLLASQTVKLTNALAIVTLQDMPAGTYYICVQSTNWSKAVSESKYGICVDYTPYILGIKTQPVSKTVKSGTTANFTVAATGKNLTYQWQYRTSSSGSWKNAMADGYDAATLLVPATVGRHGYQYRCRVTDAYGDRMYTKTVTLNVLGIKTQPASKAVKPGTTAKFTVTATGKGLTYQWQYRTTSSGSWKNASATGNKTKTLSVAATVAKDGYQYRCKITDSAGNKVYTKTVTLNVLGVKTQPANKIVKAGTTAKFTVKATGKGLTYQWQYRTSSSGSWKNASASSAKTASYSVSAQVKHNGYQYRCRITDSAGNKVYTKIVTLNVLGIKTQPVNKTVKAGATAKFTVAATGKGLTYQWQYRTSSSGSWKNVSVASGKTANYSLTAAARHNGYQYRCKITDSAGNVIYTSIVKLTVK